MCIDLPVCVCQLHIVHTVVCACAVWRRPCTAYALVYTSFALCALLIARAHEYNSFLTVCIPMAKIVVFGAVERRKDGISAHRISSKSRFLYRPDNGSLYNYNEINLNRLNDLQSRSFLEISSYKRLPPHTHTHACVHKRQITKSA